MLIFRWLVLGLLMVAIASFATFVATGEPRWRRLSVVIVRWTIIAGLGFFGVLLLERFAVLL